jgi:TRAP-type C4-dicarboxylate transport system permease small subunit
MTSGKQTLWWVLPSAILGVLMVFCVILDCANVVARYVLLSAIVSADEILGYVLIWGVFIGVTLVSRDETHLRMDLVSSILSKRIRRILRRFELLLTIPVCSLIAFKSFQAARQMAELDEKTVITDIPMVIPFSALPIGFSLIVLIAVRALWQDLRTPRR